ncbi:MAG: hypothetical protein II954_06195 [Synergistaceae bacterium]|nr:hypothetical protein [Synergistaceae bacterium]
MATDFARLDAMKDEDIDCSDIPELTPEQLHNAEGLWITPETEYVPLAINRQTMSYFREGGKGYAMRMSKVVNNLLREYVAKQQKAEGAV